MPFQNNVIQCTWSQTIILQAWKKENLISMSASGLNVTRLSNEHL